MKTNLKTLLLLAFAAPGTLAAQSITLFERVPGDIIPLQENISGNDTLKIVSGKNYLLRYEDLKLKDNFKPMSMITYNLENKFILFPSDTREIYDFGKESEYDVRKFDTEIISIKPKWNYNKYGDLPAIKIVDKTLNKEFKIFFKKD